MNADVKVARQRLSVLDPSTGSGKALAEEVSNVSEACRRRGITRTQFYEYKKRFETFGLEGLADLPPIAKSHPQTTPNEIVEKVCDLARLAELTAKPGPSQPRLQLPGAPVGPERSGEAIAVPLTASAAVYAAPQEAAP